MYTFVEKLHSWDWNLKKTSSHCLRSSKSLADKKHEIADADIAPAICRYGSWKSEGFQFNDLRLTTSRPNDYSSGWLNVKGKYLNSHNGQGSVEAIFNAIIKFFNPNCSLDIIQYQYSDWWDRRLSPMSLVSVENVVQIRFSMPLVWTLTYWRPLRNHINANTLVQKKMRVRWDRQCHRDLLWA